MVVSEVKHLVNQTANATVEISNKISTIQEITNNTVIAIGEIGDTVRDMDATDEISRNVQEAAQSTDEFSDILENVAQQANTANEISTIVSTEADKTTNQVNNLGIRTT